MIKHIVMFKFTGTEEQRKQTANGFKASLLALNGKIEALQPFIESRACVDYEL